MIVNFAGDYRLYVLEHGPVRLWGRLLILRKELIYKKKLLLLLVIGTVLYSLTIWD
jgi:hypothetical protein